ncbi:clumping factor B-like [Macrosteles quadrilineatus]|uniref:clumping factor B-like n=1 Tax=Macrosteles quadrilineatus TaxID=74068 RepID=UPI0023E2A9F1|nr:clumping factor B-like [Macrosteles quadrilineatus]XP_054290789.1 clumping factor B-like [Macrosteles quadrilineatus]
MSSEVVGTDTYRQKMEAGNSPHGTEDEAQDEVPNSLEHSDGESDTSSIRTFRAVVDSDEESPMGPEDSDGESDTSSMRTFRAVVDSDEESPMGPEDSDGESDTSSMRTFRAVVAEFLEYRDDSDEESPMGSEDSDGESDTSSTLGAIVAEFVSEYYVTGPNEE